MVELVVRYRGWICLAQPATAVLSNNDLATRT